MSSKGLLLAGLIVSCGAAAAEKPRVAVHPLVGEATPEGRSAYLVEAARQPIAMVSSFEVGDALSAHPGGSCGLDEACLAQLATATKAGWALAMAARSGTDGWQFTALVVARDGAVARRLDDFHAAGDAEAAFRAAYSALELGHLGEPVAVVAARPEPEPPEVKLPEVKTDRPVETPAVVPPVVVSPATVPMVVAAAPPVRGWHSTAALGAGAVALIAAGAGGSLVVVNVTEASRLRAALQGGLVPPGQVNAAAAIDERTIAAGALFAGAGVAAATALVLVLTDGEEPQVVASPVSGGAMVTFSGRWP